VRRKAADGPIDSENVWATPLGKKALEAIKAKVSELFGKLNEKK
jgi:hypothetical protein